MACEILVQVSFSGQISAQIEEILVMSYDDILTSTTGIKTEFLRETQENQQIFMLPSFFFPLSFSSRRTD